jgi:hypothetical protein
MPSPVSRRHFLQTSSLAAAATLANAQNNTPLIIDTHLHCFAGNNDSRFPYHPRGPYQPAAKASPEQLLNCMDGAGVNYAIVVHPEPYQDDHRYLEHCLEVGKGRLKGVCLVFADQPKSMAQLPALAKRGDIVAVRVHAYAPDRLPPFGKPTLRALWKQASDLGLAVQIHLEPRYAPSFESYIRRHQSDRGSPWSSVSGFARRTRCYLALVTLSQCCYKARRAARSHRISAPRHRARDQTTY